METILLPELVPASSTAGLAWLKSRAKGLKGAFDPSAAAAGLSRINWSIAPASGFMALSSNSSDRIFDFLGVKRTERMLVDPRENGRWALVSFPPEIERNVISRTVLVPFEKRKPLLPPVAEPGKLYVTRTSLGRWGSGDHSPAIYVDYPVMGVHGWTVTAPTGESTFIPDTPRASREPLQADAFWKWAYARGLAEAATAVLPTSAEERDAIRAAAVAKGQGTCGICFAAHSKHVLSGHIVQHGYKMGGGGYGRGHEGMVKLGGDCFGVGWCSFEAGPDATKAWAKHLKEWAAENHKRELAWHSGEIVEAFVFTAPRNYPMGRRHMAARQESLSSHLSTKQKEEGDWTVQRFVPGDAGWEDRVNYWTRYYAEKASAQEREQLWYETAAENWPKYPTETGQL